MGPIQSWVSLCGFTIFVMWGKLPYRQVSGPFTQLKPCLSFTADLCIGARTHQPLHFRGLFQFFEGLFFCVLMSLCSCWLHVSAANVSYRVPHCQLLFLCAQLTPQACVQKLCSTGPQNDNQDTHLHCHGLQRQRVPPPVAACCAVLRVLHVLRCAAPCCATLRHAVLCHMLLRTQQACPPPKRAGVRQAAVTGAHWVCLEHCLVPAGVLGKPWLLPKRSLADAWLQFEWSIVGSWWAVSGRRMPRWGRLVKRGQFALA